MDQIIIVVVILAISLLGSYSVLRRLRARGKQPKFLPGSFFKRKWESWTPNSKYRQVNDGHGGQDLATNTAYNRGVEVEERAASQAAADGVDRHTSVRSVMTLPPYQLSPKEGEQVIGREGERAGMDTVVEFPENNDEEETRREDQMESLYQIRLARRREIAEREERRRERREARDRGDWARLEELRRASRLRAAGGETSTDNLNAGLSTSAATLIAEHQSRGRDRRVSSVAYADVGQVRHDGTRLRANSNESERGGLLAGAAAMGENDGRPRASSDAASSLAEPRPHFRNRSGSSALSISTTASDMDPPPVLTPGSTQHADSDRPPRTSDSNGTSDSSPTANRFTPEDSTGSEGADIGESRIPITVTQQTPTENYPPSYDHLEWGDAPAYSERQASIRRAQSNASQRAFDSLVRNSQAPQLPQLNLPSIYVEGATEPNTPVTPNLSVGSPDPEGRRRSRFDRDGGWDEV